jgi:hypothetical protein
MLGLLFGMCRSHHAIETRLRQERKAHKKLQKDMKEVKKALYPNKTPSPLGSGERESNPLHLLSSAMQAMKALIHLSHLLPMLADLTWGFTPSLVVPLDSKVHPLHHHHLLLLLLESSQGLVWQMRSQPPSLVIQIPVWQVALLNLFIILLCHHSLTTSR